MTVLSSVKKNGNLTLEVVRWPIKHYVQISILDWNGELMTTILPLESTNVKTKFAQYYAFEDEEARLEIAKKVIEAKFEKSKTVFRSLRLF